MTFGHFPFTPLSFLSYLYLVFETGSLNTLSLDPAVPTSPTLGLHTYTAGPDFMWIQVLVLGQ